MGSRFFRPTVGAFPTVSFSDVWRARRHHRGRRGRGIKVLMEVLERRLLLTTYTITTLADDGRAGSLRWAVEQAMASGGANAINFDPSLSGTINLLNSPLHNGPLIFTGGTTTITGSSAVAVNGNDDATVFEIDPGAALTLTGITTSGGNYYGATSAGDIYNNGTLNLSNCDVIGVAQATYKSLTPLPAGTLEGSGGAIYNDSGGTLNISGDSPATSLISGHGELGGGIYNNGGTVNIANTALTGIADTGGAILNTNGGTVTISGSTISGTANIAGGAICNEANSTLNITSSTINPSSAADWGGAIANYANGTVSLDSTTVSGSTADLGGGIFNFTGAVLLITASTISGNTASEYGGGIYNDQGTITFTGSIVNNEPVGNSILNNAAVAGGGIYNLGGVVSIDSATISGNTVTVPSGFGGDATGGGIDNDNGGVATLIPTLVISNSTISNNAASNSQQGGNSEGGGIYSNSGTVDLDTSTVQANSVTSGGFSEGGGIYSNADYETIANSTISLNLATSTAQSSGSPPPSTVYAFGGGIYIAGDDTVAIVNSTIASNQALDTATAADAAGGGIWSAGTLTATNTTIASNTAVGQHFGVTVGAGIDINAGDTTLYNTIVADSVITTASIPSGLDISGTLDQALASGQTPSSYNLVTTRLDTAGNNAAGGLINGINNNIVGSAANLGPLQDNGGPTQTMALLFGSPAIDAGSNALAVDFYGNALTTDQRGSGFPRVVNNVVDIGAFEIAQIVGTGSDGSSAASSSGSAGISSSASGGSGANASPAAGPATQDQVELPIIYLGPVAAPDVVPGSTNAAVPYSPAQIDAVYGINLISFAGTAGDGSGQTIAIVDAYDDSSIVSDANFFSQFFNLPQFNVTGGPTLTVVNQDGQLTPLPVDSSPPTADEAGWIVEESLDVEWAHAVAPKANIVVVEANTPGDLMTAVTAAADYKGVSVVSMSWGLADTASQTADNGTFTAPSGHTPITFLASSGDYAAPFASYPAMSPNVVSVGGTRLSINSSNGTYGGEAAWDGGGGGVSLFELQPSYQTGNVNGASTTYRTTPDVSMDADYYTGVYVYYQGAWSQVGGTSLAAPMWAGLIAIANQGRALISLPTLDGVTQTLPMLYSPGAASDFHDITDGNNGYPATTGYDLATGLGTPIANTLIPYLVGSVQGRLVFAQQPTNTTAGSTITPAVTVDVEDEYGNLATSDTSSVTLSIFSGPPAGATLSGTLTEPAVNGVATFSDLSLNLAGTYQLQAADGSLTSATSSSFQINAGTLAKLGFVQQPTQTAAGATITPAVTVGLEDNDGNLITGYIGQITLAVGSGPGSLNGTLSELTQNGVATFSDLSLDTVGTYTLKATAITSIGSLSVTSSNFTITVGALAKLGFVQQPTNVTAGSTITPAVTVWVEDAFGNLETTDDSTVTLSLGSGSGSLYGTLAAPVQNGVATFSNLWLHIAGTHTLRATDASLAPGTSAAFTVLAATPRGIGFVQQPSSSWSNSPLTPAVWVGIEDVFGNVTNTSGATVTLSLNSGPAGATIDGTLSASTVNGIAAFNDLSLSALGTYVLEATNRTYGTALSSDLQVIEPPTTRFLFNGVPLGPMLIAMQQKNNAARLGPPSDPLLGSSDISPAAVVASFSSGPSIAASLASSDTAASSGLGGGGQTQNVIASLATTDDLRRKLLA